MSTNDHGPTAQASQSQDQSFIVREARLSDVESLTTILPRAFHPTNEYMKRALPDGPAMPVIEHGHGHAPDNAFKASEPSAYDHAIAVLALNFNDASETGPGFWTSHPLSSDHNLELCEPIFATAAEGHEKHMSGKTYFVIELFGVESAFQSRGLGGRILQEACRFADNAGYEIFVTVNGFARKFYERHAFVCKGTKLMPGGKYEECQMLRDVGGRQEAE